MLKVTDQYSISPATSKGGFFVIYVTGHVSHGREAKGLLPRVTRRTVQNIP